MPCSYYSELAGHENAAKYQTVLFLAGSASAEFFADIGLCPFEAVKVRWTVIYMFSSNLLPEIQLHSRVVDSFIALRFLQQMRLSMAPTS